LRIYLSGQGAFAVQVAESLTEAGHRITGIAAPYMRKGQSDESNPMHWDKLRAWAIARDVAWTPSSDLRAGGVPADTDVLLAAHSHAFIGRRTRARARVASLGYHPSLLPLHRGRDSVRWTVRDKDRVTGGTVYHLTERTDGGPIAAQEHVLVPPGQTAQQLWRELLAPLGIRLILRVLRDLEEGIRVEVPQDEALATWEPAMDSPPLFKPELPSITSASTESVIADRWALVDR
jgi:methionyl-tRNA formyltransferase